ncbi:MAG: hypothetical protein KDD12_21000, partial [Lewinella sp.]|nr:hypothetical protein [Lewinella sp.]
MSWLSDKIYNLADSREFRDFIDFFKLDFLCYQERLILYNDCFYVELYLEHHFPFMDFFHYKENKWAEVNRFFVDEKIDYNSLMETVRSADYIDYIGNAKALKQIYY